MEEAEIILEEMSLITSWWDALDERRKYLLADEGFQVSMTYFPKETKFTSTIVNVMEQQILFEYIISIIYEGHHFARYF